MKDKKAFWDSYSTKFDAIYGTKNTFINSVINRLFRKTMKIRYDKTLQAIHEENVSILDIGCGPGHYCFALAKSGSRRIVGIDFSEKMISLAKKHAEESGISNRLEFNVVNILEFNPPEKYDYSVMMGFIEYFEFPELIMKKAISLTKKTIMISFPAEGGILAFQRRIRYKSRCYLKLFHENDIRKLMEMSGVRSYNIERIKRDFFVTVNLDQN